MILGFLGILDFRVFRAVLVCLVEELPLLRMVQVVQMVRRCLAFLGRRWLPSLRLGLSFLAGLDFLRLLVFLGLLAVLKLLGVQLVRLGSLGMVVGWLARKGSGVVFLGVLWLLGLQVFRVFRRFLLVP